MGTKIRTQGGPGGKLGLSVRRPSLKPVPRQGGPGGKLDRGVRPSLAPRGLAALAKKIAKRADVIAQAAPHAKDFGTSGAHRDPRNHLDPINLACRLPTPGRGGTSGQEESAQIRVGNPVRGDVAAPFRDLGGPQKLRDLFGQIIGWFSGR